jgi:hypothetical protein
MAIKINFKKKVSKGVQSLIDEMYNEFSDYGEDTVISANDIEELKAGREALRLKRIKQDINTQKPKNTMAKSNNNNDEIEIPMPDYDPLAGDKIERSYSAEVSGANPYAGRDVGEPEFISEIENALQEQQQAEQSEEQEQQEEQKSKPINPNFDALDDKDKKAAAENMVDTLLGVYESLHNIAGQTAGISPKKVQKLINSGEVDAEITVPVGDDELNLPQFVEGYNQQVAEVFTYDPTFNEKVRAPLTRIFIKKGIGLTDEETVIIAFAKDIGQKGIGFYQVKSLGNSVLDAFKENTSLRAEIAQLKAEKENALRPDMITKTKQPSKRKTTSSRGKRNQSVENAEIV